MRAQQLRQACILTLRHAPQLTGKLHGHRHLHSGVHGEPLFDQYLDQTEQKTCQISWRGVPQS
jgi:hypothetical protein